MGLSPVCFSRIFIEMYVPKTVEFFGYDTPPARTRRDARLGVRNPVCARAAGRPPVCCRCSICVWIHRKIREAEVRIKHTGIFRSSNMERQNTSSRLLYAVLCPHTICGRYARLHCICWRLIFSNTVFVDVPYGMGSTLVYLHPANVTIFRTGYS